MVINTVNMYSKHVNSNSFLMRLSLDHTLILKTISCKCFLLKQYHTSSHSEVFSTPENYHSSKLKINTYKLDYSKTSPVFTEDPTLRLSTGGTLIPLFSLCFTLELFTLRGTCLFVKFISKLKIIHL